MGSITGKRLAWLSTCAVLAIGLASSPTAGASDSTSTSASHSDLANVDVELLPPLVIFNTSDGTEPGLLEDRSADSGGEDNGKGKGNGKGHDKKDEETQSSEGGSGESGGSGGSGSGGGSTSTQDPNCWTWQQSEWNFFNRINDSRLRHSRTQLRFDPHLAWVANRHSRDMAQYQRLYHTPDHKLRERVTNWQILGENVGRGATVESLHQAFMDSPDHRDVVLYRPFNYVGVGVVRDENGIWVTILFEAYENPGTTMNMPRIC